jgi:hypothetical protein
MYIIANVVPIELISTLSKDKFNLFNYNCLKMSENRCPSPIDASHAKGWDTCRIHWPKRRTIQFELSQHFLCFHNNKGRCSTVYTLLTSIQFRKLLTKWLSEKWGYWRDNVRPSIDVSAQTGMQRYFICIWNSCETYWLSIIDNKDAFRLTYRKPTDRWVSSMRIGTNFCSSLIWFHHTSPNYCFRLVNKLTILTMRLYQRRVLWDGNEMQIQIVLHLVGI